MVRFSSYMIFLFCFTIVLYFLGSRSAAADCESDFINNAECNLFEQGSNAFDLGNMLSSTGLVNTAIGLTVGIFVGLATGFSAMFAIPAAILAYLISYFILPTSFIDWTGIPAILQWMIMGFYNLILILAGISFVRGEV